MTATTLEAIGDFVGAPPTVRISGGRGNGPRGTRSIHIAFRDSDTEATHLLQGWFDAGELLEAVSRAADDESGARILRESA